MDIKKRIQELSLDQKAKLYFMGLVRQGKIDTLPEDPKAAYIRDMMDKEDPKMDPAIRSDFDDPVFEDLKEIATELGYLEEIGMFHDPLGYQPDTEDNESPSITDEDLDELLDIILKYVEDPDDAQAELDRFDQGGFDALSDMVAANLLRDPEYKAWDNKLHSIKEDEKKSYQNLPYTYEVLLDDLDFETLKSSFPEYYQNEKFIRPQTGEPYYSDNISFPNLDDSMSQIGDPEALEDWKDKIRRRFGDVIIKFNNKAKNWFDKVFVDDFEFNYAKEKFIRGKQDFIDKERKLGRSID